MATIWHESTQFRWAMRWMGYPLGVGLVPSAPSPPALRVCLAHPDITLTQAPTSVLSVHMTLTLSLMPHWALIPANPVDQPARVTRFVDDIEKGIKLFLSQIFVIHNHISLFVFQDHSLCYSDCHFTHTEGNVTLTYDFSPLGSVGSLMNGPSFTSKGTKYFHQFNISLCGGQVWRNENLHMQKILLNLFKVVCTNTVILLCTLYLRATWQYALTM